MAYKFTLADAKASGALKAIAGVNVSSQQFIDLVNEAQRRLAKRGNFFGTEQSMKLLFQGCVVAWPREVGTIMAAKSGGQEVVVNNSWFSFTGGGVDGSYGNQIFLEDLFPAPIHNPIFNSGNGMLIRYYVSNSEDIGKKITLFGKKFGGLPLQEKDSSGKTVNGVTLTAANPFVSTSAYVTDIESITREATAGMAYLYQYDPVNDKLIDLAFFQPGDTHPQFRRSVVKNYCQFSYCGTDDPTKAKFNSIEVLVKLQFVEVKNDRDFLLVDDFDALKFMIQAIKAEEANDHATAETLITKAIRELNFQQRDKSPDNQVPVLVQPLCANQPIRNPI